MPWHAIFVAEFTPNNDICVFYFKTRQLRDLNSVTHVFEIKPGFGGVGTIIDLKMNTKLKLKKKKNESK